MDNVFVLETANDKLTFDGESGRLISFRGKAACEQEFITSAPEHPVFVIQYLDADREYQQVNSLSAADTRIKCREAGDQTTLSMTFTGVGGFDLDVVAAVRACKSAPLSRWNISVRNGAGLDIVDVQYPYVVCSYALGGAEGTETLLVTHRYGGLIHGPGPELLGPDNPRYWQLGPHDLSHNHYPGRQYAQLLAYYNDRAGLYLACEDAEGNVKRFGCVHRDPGLRMGVAHIGDWPADGERTLEYDTVLGSFTGDWYQAASIYRDWTLKQKWATPLHRRKDIPSWLLDSPPQVIIRLQGLIDAGPVFPIEEFLPYEKTIPMFERIAEYLESPIVPIIASWEHSGPWVYPNWYPPIGGESSFANFARMCRERGWRVGMFGNGTRWITTNRWTDYDGRPCLKDHKGEQSLCRLPDGKPWVENWDNSWRHSMLQCVGARMTRDMAVDCVRKFIGWGCESFQFMDQNCGATAFACFAPDHEHPPAPGKWMVRKMKQLMTQFRNAAQEAGEDGVIHSTEMSVNEQCLPVFQAFDSRLMPPGQRYGPQGTREDVPLYQFLFHECIIVSGALGPAPEPYHLQIRNAANCVFGKSAGAVMIGDGTLLNRNTYDWGPWTPKIGSNDDALEMIRTVTAMRRGPGKDFLVFGRMMIPANVDGIKTLTWKHGGRPESSPAVFHAAWQSPDGRFAVVLANWTRTRKRVSITDPRLGCKATVHTCGRRQTKAVRESESGGMTLSVPALGCVLAVASDCL